MFSLVYVELMDVQIMPDWVRSYRYQHADQDAEESETILPEIEAIHRTEDKGERSEEEVENSQEYC